MAFSYYRRLSARQKRIYEQSDEVTSVRIPDASELHKLIDGLKSALAKEDRQETELLCQKLVSGITIRLTTPRILIRILAVRPHNAYGELHGLYNSSGGTTPAMITLWMRTAKQKRVVAFRTFLRTLLHEICHHLDYEYLRFPYSFHTEGFYKRESSLFHQLTEETRKD